MLVYNNDNVILKQLQYKVSLIIFVIQLKRIILLIGKQTIDIHDCIFIILNTSFIDKKFKVDNIIHFLQNPYIFLEM